MTNKEIVEGLRTALSRGHSLKNAMMSFHNAGYKKEEIEKAARFLHEHPSHQLSPLNKPIPEEFKKPVHEIKSKKPIVKEEEKATSQKPSTEKEKQIISKYEEKTKPKGKFVTILIIISLFILLSLIVGLVLFRKELSEIISSLFS